MSFQSELQYINRVSSSGIVHLLSLLHSLIIHIQRKNSNYYVSEASLIARGPHTLTG